MTQRVNIGDQVFVRLRGRTYPGVVIGFESCSIKGPSVRVETEAALAVRRPWKSVSFWTKTGTMITDSSVALVVPENDEQRLSLEREVENPPPDPRLLWMARQAGELPLSPVKKGVPQFPRELEGAR